MNKRNPGIPALPSGLVKVDKGSMRDVIVGIINGDRMPAGGFDVHGLPPNHFRVVEPGFWGLIIGAKHALDVRVIQDGKLLIEKRINPIAPPTNPFMDAKVRQMMSESPQPHFVTEDAQGKRFEFKGHDASLSAAEVVHEVARSAGAKPGQVALAWLLHKGPDIVPIPGTKRTRYLEENVAAAALQLGAAQMRALDEALAPGKVAGPRYNPATMAMVDR